MRPVSGGIKTDLLDPAVHDASVLPRAKVRRCVQAAREEIVVRAKPRQLDPCFYGLSRRRRDLELNRTLRPLLEHNGPGSDAIAMAHVSNAQLHEVASAKLAVDAQVE